MVSHFQKVEIFDRLRGKHSQNTPRPLVSYLAVAVVTANNVRIFSKLKRTNLITRTLVQIKQVLPKDMRYFLCTSCDAFIAALTVY